MTWLKSRLLDLEQAKTVCLWDDLRLSGCQVMSRKRLCGGCNFANDWGNFMQNSQAEASTLQPFYNAIQLHRTRVQN